jgi:hypothetical protein
MCAEAPESAIQGPDWPCMERSLRAPMSADCSKELLVEAPLLLATWYCCGGGM